MSLGRVGGTRENVARGGRAYIYCQTMNPRGTGSSLPLSSRPVITQARSH